ncbi:MAG: hypothetical protein AB1546_08490, partial [bacterium]
MKTIVLKNAKLITNIQTAEPATIVLQNGKIKSVIHDKEQVPGDVIYDLNGMIVTPGLCDIHTHGAGGFWGFSFNSEDVINMARTLARFGVTSFLPTTVSMPRDATRKMVSSIRQAMSRQPGAAVFDDSAVRSPGEGARILGINVEGPFLSREKPGAHNPMNLRDVDLNETEELITAGEGFIKIWTLAPEIPQGLEAIEMLSSRGIVVSLGHTNCTYDVAKEAVLRGARLFTHL